MRAASSPRVPSAWARRSSRSSSSRSLGVDLVLDGLFELGVTALGHR
jgi:hypothetical protein